MRGRLTLKASHPSSSQRVAKFYRDYPDRFVFPREPDQVAEAARHTTLVHVEDDRLQIVAVGGIYDRSDDIYDVGGIRVTRNGYRLQRVIMETAAVHVHLTRERYNQITATTFADNLTSIVNIEAAGFELWRTAPRDLVQAKEEKAAGRPFRLYYAPGSALRRMARRLTQLIENPILRATNQSEVELELAHPLFTVFGSALQAFAQSADEADEDQS